MTRSDSSGNLTSRGNNSGSLLDGLGEVSTTTARGSRRSPRECLNALPGLTLHAVGSGARAVFRAATETRTNLVLTGASVVMLAASGAVAATHSGLLKSLMGPDRSQVDGMFEYALLTEDFNRLPLEERIELIAELARKVRGMGSSDSVLMAAFAARISGPARDQLMENATRVMVDLADRHAAGYDLSRPASERKAYLENAVVDMMKTMERMAGEEEQGERDDEERLAEMREQGDRDRQAVESGQVGAEGAGRMASFLQNTAGRHTSAAEKARMTVFMRDMNRVMRGVNVETGRP
jgi:hypothetical protein